MLADLYIDNKRFLMDVITVGSYLRSIHVDCDQDDYGSWAEELFEASADYFGFVNYIPPAECIKQANCILEKIPKNSPFVGFEANMLREFLENDKDDFEIECLGAFLATRSIIGTKPYCKTNKTLIHARMFGYRSAKELPEQLTPLQQKYKIRWHMDRLLLELQTNWHLKTISNHQRGMCISYELSYEQLALQVEKNKQKIKYQQLRENKRKAIETAKTQIKTH